MADSTHIQWTDATWNPVTGCTKVSQGWRHCYIDRTPPFCTQGRRFVGPGSAGEPGATTGVQLHPDRLDWPLRWRKPRRVFVNSLSDLFHAQIPDGFIAQVFQMMAAAPQHTFQVLTKRPGRMASLVPRLPGLINRSDLALVEPHARVTRWPLPNVWLGTSVEDQQAADLRIPLLLATPAAVRCVDRTTSGTSDQMDFRELALLASLIAEVAWRFTVMTRYATSPNWSWPAWVGWWSGPVRCPAGIWRTRLGRRWSR